MSSLLRKKILYKDYSQIMDHQPVFNVDIFASRSQNWVSKHDTRLHHYVHVRNYLNYLIAEYGTETMKTRVAALNLEDEIAILMESEKANPEVQVEIVSDPIDNHEFDYEDPEDESFRSLSTKQKNDFGEALQRDIKDYFRLVKNIDDKIKWAELLLQAQGVMSMKMQRKMYLDVPKRPRVRPYELAPSDQSRSSNS